jgi:hypothetical protein
MRPGRWTTLACLWVTALPAPALADEPVGAGIYRVFLTDGTALASYGEWTRLDDRVVFSMPLSTAEAPDLHLVSLPAARVDWSRTERYARTARASHYAATRGEADFARLSATVAQTLNEVAQQPDPQKRLQVAERARRAMAEWPGNYFGYRAHEVREILGMLDEVIAELRAAAGLSRFDLALRTSALPESAETLLPAPAQSEIVDQLMKVAALADNPAERTSILRTVLALLDRAIGTLPETWAAAVRKTALGTIAEDQRIDAEYGALRTRTVGLATRLAARADVHGLERLRAQAVKDDATLGSRRPGETAALLATIDVNLDAARRLRLAHDQWRLRADGYRAYRRDLGRPLETLASASASLEDIRQLAGPEPQSLRQLDARIARESKRFERVVPPAELQGVHAVFRSAWELAASAVRLRLDAVAANSLEQARQASSAAAGALMLLSRARADLDAALQPPRIQ